VKVLGVDPGTIRTGWGIVERAGPKIRGLAAGVIDVGKNRDLAQRLKIIYDGLSRVIEEHEPAVMALEDIFFSHSVKAALVLGHARGVAVLAGANAQIEVCAYSPALVKRSVAGRGQATKEQVARIVGAIIGWKELPPLDATDALAIAITHLNASCMGPLRSRR
jgi:crossover junction endodeoxyribonuclease RuvC